MNQDLIKVTRLKIKFKIKMLFEKILNYHSTFTYREISILLPPAHSLNYYKSLNSNYDEFIGHLANFLDNKSIVIDVGANVGDTIAIMAANNATLEYIGIEGDAGFYKLLLTNIEKIKRVIPSIEITAINCIISTTGNYALKVNNHTGHLAQTTEIQLNYKLDEVIPETLKGNISLIKIDTDGFDFEVIESASEILRNESPFIFFEMQIINSYQKNRYLSCLKFLFDLGYSNFYLFDNYGNYVMKVDNLFTFVELLQYLDIQNLNKSQRTIYYYDILATPQNPAVSVPDIIEKYVNR